MTGVILLIRVVIHAIRRTNQLLVYFVAHFAQFRERHAAAVTDKTRLFDVLGFAGNQELFGGNVDDLDLTLLDLALDNDIVEGRVSQFCF